MPDHAELTKILFGIHEYPSTTEAVLAWYHREAAQQSQEETKERMILRTKLTEVEQECARLRARRAMVEGLLASLGATEEPDGGLRVDMKKYNAAFRCEAHRKVHYLDQAGLDRCIPCLQTEARGIEEELLSVKAHRQEVISFLKIWLVRYGVPDDVIETAVAVHMKNL